MIEKSVDRTRQHYDIVDLVESMQEISEEIGKVCLIKSI